MRNIVKGLILVSLLMGCRAEADFSKDLERIGFLFGAMTQGRVVDSGQNQCYDTGAVIPCQDTVYPGQDADYVGVPKPRSISAPIQKSNGDLITIDYGTGLVWTSCPIESVGNPDNTATCAGAPALTDKATAQSHCSALNDRQFGGMTEWRLPTIRDLRSLLVYVPGGPFYDSSAFPGAVSFQFWSDSVFGGMVVYADFSDGGIYTTGSSYRVRCVSGPALQPGNFQLTGGSMVTDNDTGLVFTRCAAGQDEAGGCAGSPQLLSWSLALQYCNNLTIGGRKWRLPAVQELEVTLRPGESPPVDLTFFPASSGSYWTSTTTPGPGMQAQAVTIIFDAGASHYSTTDKTLPTAAVRCVSGP